MARGAKKGERRGGVQKGYQSEAKKKASELFVSILEDNVHLVESALVELHAKDKGKFLDVFSKLAQYFVPKKMEVDTPSETKITITRKVINGDRT